MTASEECPICEDKRGWIDDDNTNNTESYRSIRREQPKHDG